ncbi:universal stress protein [Salinirubellus salinus]|jgi:nucleotide-binding universal stress UspA family protein|uniref:Universal stress protein n=1 Tax=Salinirubellus salinus TaxID=1364945 RepID=A0A9E7UAW1_9EURY|nr:universal stress protein [Salinirubellus salinus]UWM54618.1 universal stress protein [Salinirubellus salinus]
MRAVFATDLSDAIETALESRICLECLGRYGITEVHLLNVTSPNVTTGMPGSDVGRQTRRGLERQADLLREEGFDVETHVVRGTPHRRINGLAEQVGADLIIVGSRGKSPLRERFIGGTARDVARTAVRPLLVQRIVETEDEHEIANEHLFQRVLYATDFSENAERAFEQFRYLQEATQEATLLHVTPPERRSEPDVVEDAEARLAELADRLEGMGIETRTVVREGEAVEEILAAEAEFDPTSILMGSRGRSRIRRLLLGSTSEKVTARASCNVLLVPPRQFG